MKEINVEKITDLVAELCIKANKVLPDSLCNSIEKAEFQETDALAKSILSDLQRNIKTAAQYDIPVCQDTGMAVVFIELGQEVHLTGGLLYDAVNEGVRRGYEKGLLRKSVVCDPLRRINTNDNTPAVIHLEMVEGDGVNITVAPKGFGSENMSGVRMLPPAKSRQGVIEAVLDVVKKASNNPCPPMVIGVGIGGDFEQCAYLSKKALLRNVDERNADGYYGQLEEEILELVNALGIGPQGFGGKTTALAVNIEVAPTHIAGLPVAVNIGCHVTRHAKGKVE